jgi:hypothetical protein
VQLKGALRRFYAPPSAYKQLIIETESQSFKRVAHCRLAHVQALCRLGQVLFTHQNIEDRKQIQVVISEH